MDSAIQKQMGLKADVCDVCGVPLKDEGTLVKREYLGTVLTFCSEEHWKEFFEDPERYSLQQEEELE